MNIYDAARATHIIDQDEAYNHAFAFSTSVFKLLRDKREPSVSNAKTMVRVHELLKMGMYKGAHQLCSQLPKEIRDRLIMPDRNSLV